MKRERRSVSSYHIVLFFLSAKKSFHFSLTSYAEIVNTGFPVQPVLEGGASVGVEYKRVRFTDVV